MTKIVACPNCCEILHLSRHLAILEEVDDNEEREGGMENRGLPRTRFAFFFFFPYERSYTSYLWLSLYWFIINVIIKSSFRSGPRRWRTAVLVQQRSSSMTDTDGFRETPHPSSVAHGIGKCPGRPSNGQTTTDTQKRTGPLWMIPPSPRPYPPRIHPWTTETPQFRKFEKFWGSGTKLYGYNKSPFPRDLHLNELVIPEIRNNSSAIFQIFFSAGV
jgi:hypothetical protein